MTENSSYSKMLGLQEDEVVSTISSWVSELSEDEHRIRSAILDLHFSVEFQLKRFLYHGLRGTILYSDEQTRDQKAKVLNSAVGKLPMGTAMSLLEASVKMSPWPELSDIWELNRTRNRMAHTQNKGEIKYKGRNPFFDTDCLSQMYFDVWAIDQVFVKLFERVIDEPLTHLAYYRDLSETYRNKYGDIPAEEHPKLRTYPEW